jgi:hypothetical protein
VTAEQRLGCVVSDISDTGARIDVQDSNAIPDQFVLLLSSNGAARRFCRVVWRKPTQMGVKFERSLADAASATLTPQPRQPLPNRPKPNDRSGRGRRCVPTIFYHQVC